MPRPKRTKVAPSAPTAIHPSRVPQAPIVSSAARRQKSLFSPDSSERVTTGSDDSDGLVMAKKTGSKGGKETPQEYTMSGALALEDVGATRLRPPSSKTRAELTRITREADHAKARAGNAEETAIDEGGLEEIPSSMPHEPVPTGKHARSLASRKSPVLKNRQALLGSRIQETPRTRTSLLGGTGFKKRPRQPSLLQMVQHQTQDDLDDDDMYNFIPDDESTPLVKSLSQSLSHPKSPSSDQISSSRKRKQATPDILVPASQSLSTLPRSFSSPMTSQPLEREDVLSVSEHHQDSQPTLPRHRATKTPEPRIFSDTLAPPHSSSPAKPEPKAVGKRRASGVKKNATEIQQPRRKEPSPAPSLLSLESNQASPIRSKQIKPLTTATLQNLLPRRRARRKPKGDYDLPSSSDVELDNTGLGEDEDELSFHTTKVRQKKSRMSAPKNGNKSKESATKKGPKTYTRKKIVVSEDEDEDGEGTGDEEIDGGIAADRRKIPVLDGKAKAEMKQIAAKFREVDEYTLDFEDMTGSSSQMQDAR